MHPQLTKIHARITDEGLVQRTVRGDDRLYAELMRRYMRSVYGFVANRTGTEHAEHLTSLTFYTFWKSIQVNRDNKRLRRKLFEVAHDTIAKFQQAKFTLPSTISSVPSALVDQLQVGRIFSLRTTRVFSLIEIADMVREPFRRIALLPKILRHDLKETYNRMAVIR